MRVLVVGSGAREHALAWALRQSKRVEVVYAAPGNAGTSQIAHNVNIVPTDVEGIVSFANALAIDLVVVGPEASLAAGVVDACREQGIPVFGPSKNAARVESSKAFAKRFMRRAGIPTAAFRVFRSHRAALWYVAQCTMPVVVKAGGLASGKGVYICHTLAQAEQALALLMVEDIQKGASGEIIVEGFLEGKEVSLHALCDGNTAVLWPSSQDHKQAWSGGPMTGGMGVIAPVPWVTAEMMAEVEGQVVHPVLAALAQNRTPFTGALYPGLMWTSQGWKVLEYNARLGDPETQAYVRLLKTDLPDVLEACVEGRLSQVSLEWQSGFAVCVVLASRGYPDKPEVGFIVEGIEEAEKVPGVIVFHGGTALNNGLLVTSGGRVLSVTAVGATLKEALDRAYQAAKLISFEGMWYRLDIGAQALSHEP